MPKLLIVSDSPALSSGLARVTRELARRFAGAGMSVAVAGWADLIAPERKFPYPVFPAEKHNLASIFPILIDQKPDYVLGIGDPWDFEDFAEIRRDFRLIGYLNIDNAPLPMKAERALDAFDVLTTTSEFGARAIGRSYVGAIHHGVDRDVFRPIKPIDDIAGRKVADTFIVLINGQNVSRKNLPAAIAGFAKFAEGKSDVFCYANTSMQPWKGEVEGISLADVVVECDVQKKVAFAPGEPGPLSETDDATINKMYAMATVLLMPSAGEGFGLPILEAMATRTVPIATDYSGMAELIADGRGIPIKPGGVYRGSRGGWFVLVSPDDIADSLEVAYAAWKNQTLQSYWTAGMTFANARPWGRTFEALYAAMKTQPVRRVAHGEPIDPYFRIAARRAAARHGRGVGVMKIGGMGDMLQTTCVVRAAAEKYGKPVVVFANRNTEIFRAMPEVAEVVSVKETITQDMAVKSVADEFGIFLDVRYVSQRYSDEGPTEYSRRHRWFYDAWCTSSNRLHTLGVHSTRIMLTSLGLEGSTRPVFTPREPVEGLPGEFLAVSSGVGALGGLKGWPIQRWKEFATRANIPLVQIGGMEDVPIPGAEDSRGLSLAATAWILERAMKLVAVEGGMVHLAEAVGTQSVVIFGPTPSTSFKYDKDIGVSYRICQPCFWSLPTWGTGDCALGESTCLNLPAVELVLEAVAEALKS